VLNILLVDDDTLVSEILGEILTRLGHCVDSAGDGREALLMYKSRDYDLVITDVVMPGIDGQGMAHKIRNWGNSRTPIIGISGTSWLLEGNTFDAVIPKPFTVQALEDAIALALRNPILPPELPEPPVLSIG
jgi:CheY-like chemotaxis protein